MKSNSPGKVISYKRTGGGSYKGGIAMSLSSDDSLSHVGMKEKVVVSSRWLHKTFSVLLYVQLISILLLCACLPPYWSMLIMHLISIDARCMAWQSISHA